MRNPSAEPKVLPQPCPRCEGRVLLRQREGGYQAACEGSGCLFGFDADKRGRALARCPVCEEGRLKTTPKGRVCADCGKWDNSIGPCPKCKTGRLSIIKGEYGHFVGCSDLVCGLTFTCDETGRSEGGRCRLCKGPVRKTRTGSLICLLCETWQNPKPVDPAEKLNARPPEAICPGCRQALRTVWTRRRRWVYRCDGCLRWMEVPTSGE